MRLVSIGEKSDPGPIWALMEFDLAGSIDSTYSAPNKSKLFLVDKRAALIDF